MVTTTPCHGVGRGFEVAAGDDSAIVKVEFICPADQVFAVLEAEVEGRHHVLPARRLADEGLTAWAEVLARGYEGLVAKDPESRYGPGRTLAWLKVKQPHYREGERGWESKRR